VWAIGGILQNVTDEGNAFSTGLTYQVQRIQTSNHYLLERVWTQKG